MMDGQPFYSGTRVQVWSSLSLYNKNTYYMHGRITNKCAIYTRESDGFLTMLSSSTFLAKMSLVSWVHSSSIHVLSRRQHRGYNILMMMMMVMTMMMVAMIGSKSTKANNQDAGTNAVVELLKVTGKWRRSKRILRTARSNSLRPWAIKHTKEKMFSYEDTGRGQSVLIQKKVWSILRRTGIQFLSRWANFEQKY